ncbi:MAG: ATP-dependent DNA helicase [Alphaproteobacteria bacterium]|nr:ATP-dependent DNA helicase [Alphaproteobacteria bacterium]
MTNPTRLVAAAPALVVGAGGAALADADGARTIAKDEARRRIAAGPPPLVCHGPATLRRLGLEAGALRDVLQLAAFVRPGTFFVPTPAGLAALLGLPAPDGLGTQATTVARTAQALTAELAALDEPARQAAAAVAATMARGGWPWAEAVQAVVGTAPPGGLDVWRRLPEWQETAPRPPAGCAPVTDGEARRRLAAMLGANAEDRPEQADYAAAVARAFAPREEDGQPNLVVAEAGTGVGKTLGYLAPASVWAEKNDGAVWVSTYTRNLQRQVDHELDRLFADAAAKARRVVVRKGRENYLCLLNLEEAVAGALGRPRDAIALGLVARWAEATRDGDLTGGDFPAWLVELLGARVTLGLADRRGECLYSACPHYGRCFIEDSVRRARRADVVIANHALVMVQAAHAAADTWLPTHIVFDEGHHVFDAADSAFSAHLSGRETADLRRWLLGGEGRRNRSARGLERRAGDLIEDDEKRALLEEILTAARALPAEGWLRRVATGDPMGPTETFLARVRAQVLARAEDAASPYSLEAPTEPLVKGALHAAQALDAALARLAQPMVELARRFARRLDEDAATLDGATRVRLEAQGRALERRGTVIVPAWRAMLAALGDAVPEAFVDWFAIDRIDGHDIDVGYHRHGVDPTKPFAEAVVRPAHGVLVTSATLRDAGGDPVEAWQAAETLTGAAHLDGAAVRVAVPSPFDYARQTRVLVVRDVRRDAPDDIAAAYRELFLAAGGGALGLFTAIARLRAVHARIGGALEAAGIPLYAQHVDAMDTGTLVDIFRAEERACLLGTDAVRDGVDVPGPSLRLIVFDRVPWPRPDILHKARRAAFGGARFDDRIARLKLRQAFGRLVRRADDRGVFVMLDAMLPSRLASAFPEGVAVERCGLAAAIAATRAFLAGYRGD